MNGLLKFVVGSTLGATLGATIGALLAPKSGEETQKDAADLLERVRVEGDEARREAEEQVAERFRQRVNDPTAFKPQP